MLPPPKSRVPGGPLRGVLLTFVILAGLVLLSAAYGILSQGRPDIRLCLPVGLVFTVLLASAPLAYAAFQEQMTTRQFLSRLGQSRTAWRVAAAFAGAMLLMLAGAVAWTATGHTLPPAGTPVAQAATPVVATATTTPPRATPTLTAPAAAVTAGPTLTHTAAPADAPTATPSPTPPATATPTNTPVPPTATPTTEPTAAPTATATATATATELPPDPAAQIDEVMVAANDLLVALLENPDAPREPLQVYFCGENAWRKIGAFLTRTAARADRPVSAAYEITDIQPAIQDLDERWVLEQVERWTYTSASGQQTGSRESYLYYLVATDDPARPFCIDDYSAQTIP